MKKIFFTGHITFSNRGTEAILKSLCSIIDMNYKDISFIIPSDDPTRDKKLWGNDPNVEFVKISIPFYVRLWTQLTRFNFLQKFFIKFAPKLPRSYLELISSADYVFSVGGDMYTYEGRFPLWIYLSDQFAHKVCKKVYLVGATISEFPNKDHKYLLMEHFSGFEKILLRDSSSFHRLKNSYRAENIVLTADSAFSLEPKKSSFIDDIFNNNSDDEIYVGINVSPLLDRLGDTVNLKLALESLILSKPNYKFIFISHVFASGNNDLDYIKDLISSFSKVYKNIEVIDKQLSSQELKYAISKLNLLIAARTHATIAAYSSGVPVINIAYSDKAFGIALDMYGTDEYAIPFQDINPKKLSAKVNDILRNKENILNLSNSKVDNLKNLCKDNLSSLKL